jgi:S-adenosylmethionine-diacylgycerolhomoserine-N-methlytransferase
MDGIYRHQRHIYDATRKYLLLGRDRLLDELKPPREGTILEVGCGTGRNLILAARCYPSTRLYGLDISRVILATAKASIARAGLVDRITLAEADATSFDFYALFGRPYVDRVIVSYALSMIPSWRSALSAALAAVAPGGRLQIVDFGQQEGMPRWFKAALFARLERFSVRPPADLPEALEALAEQFGARLRYERIYRGYCDYAVLTRP